MTNVSIFKNDYRSFLLRNRFFTTATTALLNIARVFSVWKPTPSAYVMILCNKLQYHDVHSQHFRACTTSQFLYKQVKTKKKKNKEKELSHYNWPLATHRSMCRGVNYNYLRDFISVLLTMHDRHIRGTGNIISY